MTGLSPADDHPHVTEGVCVCPMLLHKGSDILGIEYSLRCGLSAHRVQAAAAAEIQRSHR